MGRMLDAMGLPNLLSTGRRWRRGATRLTRRQFAAVWVGAVIASCGPRPAAAQALPAVVDDVTPLPAGPWTRLDATLAEIQALESAPENQRLLVSARETIKQVEPAHAIRTRRLARAVQLIQDQRGTSPALLDEITPSLGALSLTPEEVTPFVLEQVALERERRELEERAVYLRATHRTRSPLPWPES